MISDKIIDEVISRADIVDVISSYIKVKRSGGANYSACCPFHKEKTPSFFISQVKQLYHCFGCGASGNVIGFIMNYRGLDFINAVKELAIQYGVTLPEDNFSFEKPAEKKERLAKLSSLTELMQQSAAYYQVELKKNRTAYDYLIKRGLNNEVINQFKLGYAPNSYQNLASLVSDYKTNPLLSAAGLVLDNEDNRRYDRFRNRIIFPIFDLKGNLCAFGGRVLDNSHPKYLNSPESELFHKSDILYGLNLAIKPIREVNQAFIVEGYLDVISLYQFGVKNVVASMGTALNTTQIKQLFKFTDNICFAFDGDSAGQKAAFRALENSLEIISDLKSVKFLFLPESEDPDSFIRSFGRDAFLNKANCESVGIINFLLTQLGTKVNLTSDEGRAKYLTLVKPYLEKLKANALKFIFKEQLANIVKMDPQVIESILNNRSRYAFYNFRNKKIQANFEVLNASKPVIDNIPNILKALLLNPSLAREFPLPEADVFERLDSKLQALLILIEYLELHCEDFKDVDLDELGVKLEIAGLNLDEVYQEALKEANYYANPFNLNKEHYCKLLEKIIYGKKRPLPKKLI